MNQNVCACIVDVDGTLYSQRKMRLAMGARLFTFVLLHPWRLSVLLVIRDFRRAKEKSRETGDLSETIYSIIGEQYHLKADDVKKIIYDWMFVLPMAFLKRFAYNDIIHWLNEKRKAGMKVFVYSDYEATEKINELGLEHDGVFVSDAIGYMKPNKKAMEYILNEIKLEPNACLYIGDRDEIDGAAARSVGIDYINIREWRRKHRRHQPRIQAI